MKIVVAILRGKNGLFHGYEYISGSYWDIGILDSQKMSFYQNHNCYQISYIDKAPSPELIVNY